MRVSSWTRCGAVIAACLLATVAVGVGPAAARTRSACAGAAARSTGRHAARDARKRKAAKCTRRHEARRSEKHSSVKHSSSKTTTSAGKEQAAGVALGSSESASPLIANDTTDVSAGALYGSGSSLQKVAQVGSSAQNWVGLVATWDTTASDESWSNGSDLGGPTGSFALTSAPSPTEVNYDSTSSGSGLGEFGNTTGSVNLADDVTAQNAGELDGFIGSDDPPTSGDLTDANTASGGVDEVTVPVFQAPIALALSLPNGIVVGANGKINLSNTLVQDIYNDNVPSETNGSTVYPANSWGALLTLAGLTLVNSSPTATQFTDAGTVSGTCTSNSAETTGVGGNQCIELEVRNGGSGTTYSTQGFLSLSGDTAYNSFSDNEALWPAADTTDGCPTGTSSGSCDTAYDHGYNTGNSTGNTGSSQLVKNVLADPGTIGYVNLADAAVDVAGDAFTDLVQTTTYDSSAGHQYLFAGVQDNYVGNPTAHATYAEPGAVNNVPSGGSTIIAVNPNVYTGNNINESGVYSFGQTTVGDWKVVQTANGQSLGGSVPADPDTAGHGGGSTYPIIAATYDAAWQNYSGGKLPTTGYYNSGTNATAVGNSVISYLAYLTHRGQADLLSARIGYADLPTAIDNLAIAAWESINP